MEPDVMVYLMTGFLDSGKTQFLKFTLEQEYFQIDGTTLLILCEEGEEEYSPEMLKEHRIVMETIDDPEALTEEWLEKLDEKYLNMAKDTTGSDVGTGGMATKLNAARIASYSGADMIIANAKDVGVLHKIFEDDFIGTVFLSNKDEDFYIPDFIEENMG